MKQLYPILLFASTFFSQICAAQSPIVIGSPFSCFEEDNTYQLNDTHDATEIVWSITGAGGTINNLVAPQTLSLPAGASVMVHFGAVGTAQVCAKLIGGPLDGQSFCKSVTQLPFLKRNLPALKINGSDLPYIWPSDNQFVLTQTGGQTFTTFESSYLGCDSMIVQTVFAVADAKGVIYFDLNGNGTKDAQEPLSYGTLNVVDAGGNIKYSEPRFGNYELNKKMVQGDKIVFVPADPAIVASPAFYVYSPFPNNVSRDFALSNAQLDWGTDINNVQQFVVGFKTSLKLTHYNVLGSTTNKVGLILPNALQFLDANPAFSYKNGDTLFWNVSPVMNSTNNIAVSVKTKVGTPIGSALKIKAFVGAQSAENLLTNNEAEIVRTVFGAFDPNAKESSRQTMTPTEIADGKTPIEYVLHFQNTGNYLATNVFLIDTLSNLFDLASLKVVRASHDFSWKLTGNVLRFDFNKINLPDSTSNLLGSMGWVKFLVKPIATLVADTKITNACDIYFDFNAPIRTEDAVTWVTPFGAGNLSELGLLEVFPNPTTNWLNLKWKQPAQVPGFAYLVDNQGITRHQQSVPEGENTLKMQWDNLPNGNYWVVIQIGPKRMVKAVILQFGNAAPLRRR